MKLSGPLVVFLPDTLGVEISRFGKGNLKIGATVYTYSRHAGKPAFDNGLGTCPGSTPECEAICYAKKISGPVFENYRRNVGSDVPEIPADATALRIHVSGDFDSVAYIDSWITRIEARPDVTVWAYTRSWRVPALLPGLERLRALPNVQLFASMDVSTADEPPAGWRRAWIDGDRRASWDTRASDNGELNSVTADGVNSYVCPEETGHKRDCLDCGYCFNGKRNDVTFLRH